ncbi:MAG: hypothetical protein IJ890_04410 [Clostridia bacterium]|nr:hypothetical protein [Clostridia bacterium]
MNNEERITLLENRIESLEEELQELKRQVAVFKRTGGSVIDATNSVYSMPIEEMDLSVRSFNCLKRAGFNTLGDCLKLSEGNYLNVRNLGRKSFDEVVEKIEVFTNPAKVEALRKEKERKAKEKAEAEALSLEMSKKIIPAYEVYVKMRAKAKEEGIGFYHMGSGRFASLFRRSRNDGGYVYRLVDNNTGILNLSFCKACMDGKHPEMYKLLTCTEKEIDDQLIKAAIIEDFTENNVIYNHKTKTYADSLRFIKLIQEFKE